MNHGFFSSIGTSVKKIRPWIIAARLPTLSASLIPVLVGSAYARKIEKFQLSIALVCFAAAIFIQIGTNFVNDLFDFRKGADTPDRLGPTRTIQAGLLTQSQMILGTILVFLLALGLGIYLTYVAGPMVILIGVFSILAGIAYTAGPYPLGYHGLGDIFVFIFFGFVAVCGTIFVQAKSIPIISVLLSLPVGALTTAILVVNNVRDEQTDRLAGKKTLVVRFGHRFGLIEYFSLIAIAYLIPLLIYVTGDFTLWVFLPWITLPEALFLCTRLTQKQGKELNPILIRTARLLLLHGILWAIGIGIRS